MSGNEAHSGMDHAKEQLGRALLALSLLGCTSPSAPTYELQLRIAPAQASVTVDGSTVVQGQITTYDYPSYGAAVSELVVGIIVQLDGQQLSQAISPGYCETAAADNGFDVGVITLESLSYIVESSPLRLELDDSLCEGTRMGFAITH